MATFTCSEISGGYPNSVHAGVASVSAVGTKSTSTTASSMFKLVKVPAHCVITGFSYTVAKASPTTATTVKLGVQLPHEGTGGTNTWTVTESALRTNDLTVTGGTLYNGSGKLPYRVSASNNAHVNYAWVVATSVGVLSNCSVHRITVYYNRQDGEVTTGANFSNV